jgi:hypothetical protein
MNLRLRPNLEAGILPGNGKGRKRREMEIKRTADKWEIEASSRDEAEHLDFLLVSLAESYARPASTADASQANRLQTSDHTLRMAASD